MCDSISLSSACIAPLEAEKQDLSCSKTPCLFFKEKGVNFYEKGKIAVSYSFFLVKKTMIAVVESMIITIIIIESIFKSLFCPDQSVEVSDKFWLR